jgi:hypothetical protein
LINFFEKCVSWGRPLLALCGRAAVLNNLWKWYCPVAIKSGSDCPYGANSRKIQDLLSSSKTGTTLVEGDNAWRCWIENWLSHFTYFTIFTIYNFYNFTVLPDETLWNCPVTTFATAAGWPDWASFRLHFGWLYTLGIFFITIQAKNTLLLYSCT